MSHKTVTISTAAWFGDAPLDLTFPESWDVEVCKTWAEVERELTVDHRGRTKVAVYPCAAIQGQAY